MKKYTITKTVEAENIKEAISKEPQSEIESIQIVVENTPIGFKT